MGSNNIMASLEMNLKTLKLPTILKSYTEIARLVVEENLSCEQSSPAYCRRGNGKT